MSKSFGLVILLPIWFTVMLFLAYVTFFRLEVRALEDWRLKQVVNNCTDSAIEELLEASDLGMDYADWGRFNADPDLALDDFVTTFLLSYNLPITNANKDLVKTNYITSFCVAGYDGYYIYDHRNDDNGGYTLIGSPKMPYTYIDQRTDRNDTYALNMGYLRCYKVTDASISVTKSPFNKKKTMEIINSRISDTLMQSIDRSYENGWLNNLYLPSSLTTISRANPIESPTVLCFMDNVDLDSTFKVNAFGIGGSRAKVARPVSAYGRVVDGQKIKYYSYHDLLPEGFDDDAIVEVYMSPEDAAREGYHHDPLYMN